MEYNDDDDNREGVVKWPFYASSLFILVLVLTFAYLHYEKEGLLGQWQITSCIFASAIASILVFIPHLMDRFISLAFDPRERVDDDLNRKNFLEIKEIRNDLDSLAVKVDKVPSVVDKILSSNQNTDQLGIDLLPAISEDLGFLKNTVSQKLSQLEELLVSPSLLPESDPSIEQTKKSLDELGHAVTNLSSQLEEFELSVMAKMEFLGSPVDDSKRRKSVDLVEENPSPLPLEKSDTESTREMDEVSRKEYEGETRTLSTATKNIKTEEDPPVSEKEIQEIHEFREEGMKREKVEKSSDPVQSDDFITTETIDENEDVPSSELSDATEQKEQMEEIELELDLPDPNETLRKVDALLAGESTEEKPKTIQEDKPSKRATAIIANVMIGIGNKPFLRGEGPGLSWEEGVPMNFVEIGKWAWSPSRKNASVTVQVYRNDEDPDNRGKFEVKSGEKIEITPEF